jgi:hypothetical protein
MIRGNELKGQRSLLAGKYPINLQGLQEKEPYFLVINDIFTPRRPITGQNGTTSKMFEQYLNIEQ